MYYFRGAVRGSSRVFGVRNGSKESGLQAFAASWQGAVRVDLKVRDGVDWAFVSLKPWVGFGRDHPLYEGPIDGESAPQILREMHGRQLLSEPAREEWAQEPSGLIAPARRRLVL